MARKKIAILGGGLGGLSAAYFLSATPELREQHDITVYQMGWRLGGKCATGRGPADRVQEHGIHLFGGGYYNALAMMRAVYDELRRPGGSGWHVDFDNAFEPQSVSLAPRPGGRGVSVLEFWRNGLQPGIDAPPASPLRWLARGLLNLVPTMVRDALRQRGSGGPGATRATLAYAWALIRGTVIELLWRGRSLPELDDQRWDDWLRSHGAGDATLDSAIAQSPLRLLYLYPDANPQAHPRGDMGAGAYLHWVLRSAAYMGTPFWFFREGTGDSVVLPLHELLKRRGVRFEFFHAVERLEPDASGRALGQVRLRVQATTHGGQPYEPLVTVHGRPAWPDRPRYAQLEQGALLQQRPPGELEDAWSTWACDSQAPAKVLRARQPGDHDDDPLVFDQVVLAISLGALPTLCQPLIQARPAWQALVKGLPTVETHTLQLWLSQTSEALTGQRLHAEDPDDTGLGSGLPHPFDGFSDFTPLLAHESWPPAATPKSLWYFSDVLAGSPPQAPAPNQGAGYEAQRQAAALQASRHFVDATLPALFTQRVARNAAGTGFDDALLVHAPGHGPAPGADALSAQWARAHVQPSERYVQAPAGTTRLRLEAGASGFDGLVLAGDWIYTGLNVGCVEATVMSGRLAANAVNGRPAGEGLVGYFPKP